MPFLFLFSFDGAQRSVLSNASMSELSTLPTGEILISASRISQVVGLVLQHFSGVFMHLFFETSFIWFSKRLMIVLVLEPIGSLFTRPETSLATSGTILPSMSFCEMTP